MVLDELHLSADDANITTDHIIFLLDKYRALLLKQAYKDIKKPIPESNYQTICLDMKPAEGVEGDPCSGKYLKSVQEIPNLIGVGTPRVSVRDYFAGEITYVTIDRFRFTGHNKWLSNFIYCTIGPDGHLFMKSANPQAYYLEEARFSGIFEDSAAAAKLSCDGEEGDNCDVMDKDFPLEEAFIASLIEAVRNDLRASIYLPSDDANNANDDLTNNQSMYQRRYNYDRDRVSQ
jgi:hypothetical protein